MCTDCEYTGVRALAEPREGAHQLVICGCGCDGERDCGEPEQLSLLDEQKEDDDV